MWTRPEYQEDHVTVLARSAHTALRMQAGYSILDIGAGAGHASAYFQQQGLSVLAIDIARNALEPEIQVPLLTACLWDMPVSIGAKWAFCADVMEHIPPDHVEQVLAFVARSAETAVFSISTVPDTGGALINEVLHMTVEPSAWWTGKMERLWRTVHLQEPEGSSGFITICTHSG
ncbi:class I SAM-dependent methyltransferase [Marinibaculum pumilum]|uniref:Class I SAM-dependent methyltransferase n=1 Tax=Marinibaculum pumilum TaxID=1766165 RepID=A0ABV7KVR7_9PROT